MLYIKVDYSEECKKTGKRGIPKEFAVYTRKHFWQKWIEASSFFTYEDAIGYAIELRRVNRNFPKYF